ncbi:DUF5331 domain-containing protein [Geminocystis sp.]|uniref:DUF5331 domain-containing protein n=1 Tax=Geminocystis sp. TaxID=2664100 RepID=UPI0035948E03
MGIVEEFEELKPIIKDKWLDFYENNLSFCKNIRIDNYQYKSGGQSAPDLYRPNGLIILTTIILLEPKMKDYIQLLSMANSDTEKIVELLRLNFDPKIELEKRKEEKAKNQFIEPPSLLDDFRK